MHEPTNELSALFVEAAEAARRLAPAPSHLQPPDPVNVQAVQDGLRRSQPVVLTAPPRVSPADFAAAWQRMAAVVERHRPEGAAAIGRCRSALIEGSQGAEGFVIAVLQHDTETLWDWAWARNLDPQWLYLVSELAARPFLKAFAAVWVDRLDVSRWRATRCPICGRSPNVGVIQGDNFKRLHCPGCSTQWPVRRYGCGWCGADDRGALHFFVVDQWPGWRVETCNRCRRYLKVIDYREPGTWSPDQDLLVEDARTLTLDVIAQEQGYGKPEARGGNGDRHAV